jgi:hypothetical protein
MKLKIVLSILLAILAATFMVNVALESLQATSSIESAAIPSGQGLASSGGLHGGVQPLGDERDGGWP